MYCLIKKKNNATMYRMKTLFNKYILLVLASSILAAPAFASIDYEAGMTAYSKGNMQTAKVMFQKAIAKNRNDVNAHYMYAQILTKEKKYDLAKQEYNTVIRLSPNSQAAQYSKQGITAINNYLKSPKTASSTTTNKATASTTSANKTATSKTTTAAKSSTAKTTATKSSTGTKTAAKKPTELEKLDNAPHYLKNAYRLGSKYTRPNGTIRVYIPNSKYKPLMKKAYSEWQSAIGGTVFFTFVENSKDASDVVQFSGMSVSENAQEGGHCAYNIQNGQIVGNTIVINTTNPKGQPLSNEMIYHTMLHEVGHSIGIMGHSTNRTDIMATGTSTPIPHLSARDRRTARLLYQNYTSSSNNVSKQAAIKAKQTELEDITKRVKNHPSAYIDLGDLAYEQGNYSKAIEHYQKAESMTNDKNLYYRFIKVYQKTNDVDNELVYSKKILSAYPSEEPALRNILYIYAKQRRYKEGQAILYTYLDKNPQKANTPAMNELKAVFSDKNIKAVENREKFINRRKGYYYR